MPINPKNILSKIMQCNHVILITQKSDLIKLNWEQRHQLAFITIVRYKMSKCLSFEANKKRHCVVDCLKLSQVTIQKFIQFYQFQFHCLRYDYNMNHSKLQRLQISAHLWLDSSRCGDILSQIPTYTIPNGTYIEL